MTLLQPAPGTLLLSQDQSKAGETGPFYCPGGTLPQRPVLFKTMTAITPHHARPSYGDLEAENQALKAENERLKAENSHLRQLVNQLKVTLRRHL